MKTFQFIIAISAILLFSNLLSAKNPLSGTADDFTKRKLMQLTRDITLTDSQKALIETKAKTFAVKIINKDSIAYYTAFPQAAKDYKAAIDSILTPEQKTQIVQKQTERREAAIAKFKNNK